MADSTSMITPVSTISANYDGLITFSSTSNSSDVVFAALIGDSTFGPVQGSGGWQVIDRPKTVAATQWYDRSVFQLQMNLIIEDSFAGAGNTEKYCQMLESWLDVSTSSTNYQPDTFTLAGPIPGTTTATGSIREWFIYTMSFGNAIRNSPSNRIYQEISITCYEYQTPIPGGTSTSPAANAAANARTPQIATGTATLGSTVASGQVSTASTLNAVGTSTSITTQITSPTGVVGRAIYTIKPGDTLAKIASTVHQNSAAYIAKLKAINNIRDDSTLSRMVGQKIQLPA
jgi:LysM repeat protein